MKDDFLMKIKMSYSFQKVLGKQKNMFMYKRTYLCRYCIIKDLHSLTELQKAVTNTKYLKMFDFKQKRLAGLLVLFM